MKYMIFVTVFLSVSVTFAEKLIVSRTNHKGYTFVDFLEKNNNQYFISGYGLNKKINPKTKDLFTQTFNYVQKMNSRKIASLCEAGQFTIILEDSKRKSRTYRGCYDDVLYRQVILNIKKLRKEAQSIQ